MHCFWTLELELTSSGLQVRRQANDAFDARNEARNEYLSHGSGEYSQICNESAEFVGIRTNV